MCVIMNIKPGQEVPFDRLESACHVNSNGFGVSFVDRGKIEVIRDFNKDGTNPEFLARILEQARDHEVLAHLRYSTVGGDNLDNTHPFQFMNKKDHGRDAYLMHNGTIHGDWFRGDDRPDSYHFSQNLLLPLFERHLYMMTWEDVYNDPFINRLIVHMVGRTNVLTILDDTGHIKIINKDKGKEFDWGWASNEYSFNRSHREPFRGTGYSYKNDVYSYSGGSSTSSISNSTADTSSKTGTSVVPFRGTTTTTPVVEPDDSSKPEDVTELKRTIGFLKPDGKPSNDSLSVGKRKTFCELTGLASLDMICQFEMDDIYEMVCQFPEAVTTLILDLQFELYTKKKRLDALKEAAKKKREEPTGEASHVA